VFIVPSVIIPSVFGALELILLYLFNIEELIDYIETCIDGGLGNHFLEANRTQLWNI